MVIDFSSNLNPVHSIRLVIFREARFCHQPNVLREHRLDPLIIWDLHVLLVDYWNYWLNV